MGLVHRNHAQNAELLSIFQGSDLSWPLPQETMCHHQIAVLAQKVKPPGCPPLLQPQREQTKQGLEATRPVTEFSCWLSEWVSFGTLSPFLKTISSPEGWEGFLSQETTQGACAWGYFLPWRDIKGSCSRPVPGGVCGCLCQMKAATS